MRRIAALLLAVTLALLSACGASENAPPGAENAPQQTAEQEEHPSATVFPTSSACLAGDTMPYFEDGTMNVFYLADQRDGKTGYHPWALLRTKDYCSWEDMGVVIPYGDSVQDQDIALGTGCVIKDKAGLYHAFYTGHNDHYAPKEAIMHATSSDMLNWTKLPDDTFIANETYSQDDFRDPYVFYVEQEQCWWMLIVTRAHDTGVIAKYTSTDLSHWTDGGILFEDDMGFGTNMECPTLLNYNGVWYLTFSDQWPDRVVHYRIAKDVNGPFEKPEQDYWDSNGFYAGRLETDGEHLYTVGWNGTKVDHLDENDYDWAGSMVVHQLRQGSDGLLKPVVNESVVSVINHELSAVPTAMTETVQSAEEGWRFSGSGYEVVRFAAPDNTVRIEADLSGIGTEDFFGFSFAPDLEYAGSMSLVFNVKEKRVEFYNVPEIMEADAQSAVDFDFSGRDSVHVTLVMGDGVASLYVADEVVLTARMYRSQGTDWQLFGVNSGAVIKNIHIYD